MKRILNKFQNVKVVHQSLFIVSRYFTRFKGYKANLAIILMSRKCVIFMEVLDELGVVVGVSVEDDVGCK